MGYSLLHLVPPSIRQRHASSALKGSPPNSGEQTPNQRTDTRHQQKQKGSGQLSFSALTALCCLNPGREQGPNALLRQTGLGGGCWGSCLHLGASSTKARKRLFRKGEQCLTLAWMDLQACLGFSAASSHTHIKESFRPAAIRGPVTR